MINIRKYFYSFTVVFVLLTFAWFVALELTKQRIQLEAENKINNFKSQQTPFIWNFESFTGDVVEPYQKYWQQLDSSHYIKANKGQNPQLSLNFSSEVINTSHHSILQIDSTNLLQGTVKIQFKTELDDDYFYYSSDIKLAGKQQVIDLQQSWQGISDKNSHTVKAPWGTSAQKVSSLVLYFNNPDTDLVIESISMPYAFEYRNIEIHEINCLGEIQTEYSPSLLQVNIFVLQAACWLPSTYMWLKQQVQQNYPESILSIAQVGLWPQTYVHKVNKSYTNILLINTALYVFIVLVILAVTVLTGQYSTKVDKSEGDQRWTIKRLLLIGGKKAISPYHVLLNYAFVLTPSFIIFTYLAFLKFPDSTTFKLLPMYFVWALFQQFILAYVLAEKIFFSHLHNRLLSSVLAALVFAIIHMPSVTLMLATFVAGSFWAYSWLLFKRFIPLAISHAVLALMFYYVVSDGFLYSAKVLHWFWT
ncbi:MAG: CPBP family intramembrane metalloprotease [Alcanivoracaceae bacterium]|nr:CPBP family intramembrane metalloprotease [Alcanivoracaceae bacterium]